MSAKVLIDTGPIVAILSRQDAAHNLCIDAMRNIRGPLLTCLPVVTEAAWLLRAYPAAVEKLLHCFDGQPFELLPLTPADLPAISGIVKKYASLRLQLADAALVHLAQREGIDTIFTLDRRDFSLISPSRGRRLHLIP